MTPNEPQPAAPAGAAELHEVVVVGGGGTGLSVAALLAGAGVDSVVLERSAIAASWRSRYERLHLHTHRLLSSYPRLRPSRKLGTWISRDGMVEYLETYARHHELDVRIGVEAFRIDRPGDLWEVATSAGTFSASHVVVATGYNRRPRTPDWPGASGFTGGLIHAADYRNFNDFGSREVLVIGSGNTGAEISQDLSEHGAGKVWISIRTPPHIVPRNIGPLPITAVTIVIRRLPSWMTDPMVRLTQRLLIGDLEPYGLARPRIGAFARHRQEPDYIPLLDIGFVRALRSGAVEVVAAVERMEGPRVHLADGTVLEPDAVITAIGYERGLEPLVGHLGVLAVNGAPLPQPNQPPGLHFVGYLNDFNGAIWAHSWEARRVSRSIRRTLDNRQELSQLA